MRWKKSGVSRNSKKFDKYFDGVLKHAVDVAAAVDTKPTAPRIQKKQVHRDNTEFHGPLQYYLRNIAIPFIERIIAKLDAQFSEIFTKVSKLLVLVPSVSLPMMQLLAMKISKHVLNYIKKTYHALKFLKISCWVGN